MEVDDTHATKRTKFKGHKSNLLTLSFPNDPRPFVLAETPPGNRVSVMTDPRNFGSVQQHDVTAIMGPGHLDQGLTLDVTGTNAFKMICRPDPRWPRHRH